MDIDNLVKAAFTSFLVITTVSTAMAANHLTTVPSQEKCYGIVKAGMNDCATAKQSCAGSATKDRQGDAFLFVPQGLCSKIVGGSLSPIESDKQGVKG